MPSFLCGLSRFYRRDCCWPYSLSFFLALVVYLLDFFAAGLPGHWPSLAAFLVLAAYYLRLAALYRLGRLGVEDPRFFIRWLSFKIFVWGAALAGLYAAV